MAAEQPKDTTSFFRKVVKFVANPSTDWTELDSPVEDTRESDYAKGELKAMIERKRRNDFVRKREFDMLRKVRREGLSSEQLAALGSSRLDDSQPRISDQPVRQDAGVKAKIDEIEQQMVGDNYATTQRARAPEFYNAPTQPVPIDLASGRPVVRPRRRRTAGGSRISWPRGRLRRGPRRPRRRRRPRSPALRRLPRSGSRCRQRRISARRSQRPMPR